jgi:hypothetical protein
VQLSLCCEENEHTIFMQRGRCSVGSVRPELDNQPQKGGCVMRLNRLFALGAAVVTLTALASAQFQLVWDLAYLDGTDAPDGVVDINGPNEFLVRFRVFSNDTTNFPTFTAWGLSLSYDPRQADLAASKADGVYYYFNTLGTGTFTGLGIRTASTYSPSQLGGGAGQIFTNTATNVTMQIAVASGGRVENNNPPAEVAQKGGLVTFIGPDGETDAEERVPLRIRFNFSNLQVGDKVAFSLNTTPQDPTGWRIIARRRGESQTREWSATSQVIGNTFQVIPEPASMIALGSGLVGLLALRRRRSN